MVRDCHMRLSKRLYHVLCQILLIRSVSLISLMAVLSEREEFIVCFADSNTRLCREYPLGSLPFSTSYSSQTNEVRQNGKT